MKFMESKLVKASDVLTANNLADKARPPCSFDYTIYYLIVYSLFISSSLSNDKLIFIYTHFSVSLYMSYLWRVSP